MLFTTDDRLCFQALGVAETCSTLDDHRYGLAPCGRGEKRRHGRQYDRLYRWGVRGGQGSVGSLTTPSGAKQIGALLSSGSYTAHFKGHLDDVRLYNRALIAAEVQRLAQGRGCVTDGSTWATAFRELQCALSSAVAGDQIWIGEGVYKPGVSPTQTFNLMNGVNLHGGFLGLSPGGGETALDQRPDFNPDAPLTILSGDVLGNDCLGYFTTITTTPTMW